uniref:Variant surface glycoprotein 383 n=1 Tax=Trypanosoma brucei TaxID=5691 RepID=M4SXZ8_9TRYP|nr:variant surface glycoprotein 383 [Trypanosoma brucei]
MLLRFLTVFLLFIAAPETTIAAVQKENGGDFQLLCAVVALANAEPEMPGVPDLSDDKIQHVRALNMSTADEKWQEVFKGGSAANKWETRQKKSGPEPFQSHWATTYDDWVKDKERVDSGSGDDSWLAQNPRPITAEGQRAAAEKINATLSRILSLHTTLRSKITEAKETKPNEAKAQLRQAVYGTGVADSKFDATKSIASASTWTSGCASNGGKSVIGDIMCICGTANSDADQCNSVGISFKWNGNNDDIVATAIQTKCPKPRSGKYTAATLHRLISTVTARIRYEKTGTNALVPYLGKTASGTPGTCDGRDGQSCVIYKFDTSKSGATTAGFDISWLNHLVLAADALEQAEKAAQQANKLSEQVNDLQTTCEEAYKAKRYNRQPAQATKSDVATSKAEKARQKTQCPRKNTTAEECPEAHCDYDAKAQECKPKPGTETTAAETGDGAAGTPAATGCARHGTDKTTCENDKTGDKQNCAWRKGKDNGPDQEKEMCRSGSFLVNKKFSLRTAAFMSLIAL